MSTAPVAPLALSPAQAAKAIGVCLANLTRDRRDGQLGIPFVRAGSRILYPVDMLLEWQRERAQVTPRKPEPTPELAPEKAPEASPAQGKRRPGRPCKRADKEAIAYANFMLKQGTLPGVVQRNYAEGA